MFKDLSFRRFSIRLFAIGAVLGVLIAGLLASPLFAQGDELTPNSNPYRINASTLDKNALFDNTTRHFGFDVRNREELEEILPQLGRLAPGRSLRVIWVDPNQTTDTETVDLLAKEIPEGAELEIVNFDTTNAEQELAQSTEALQEYAAEHSDVKEEVAAYIEEDIQRYEQFKQHRSIVAKTWGGFKNISPKALDWSAFGIGIAKTSIGVAVWLYKGNDAVGDAYTFATIAAASGASLDFIFQRYAESYVDFKKNFSIKLSKVRFNFRDPLRSGLRFINSKLAAPVARYAPSLTNRVNRAAPWTKAFAIDQVVGGAFGFYFRGLGHLIDPTTTGSPLSLEWAANHTVANIIPMGISSGGEMSSTALMEKGIISRPIRWAFLQAWGLAFWSKNLVLATGANEKAIGGLLFYGIISADVLSKVAFIVADKLLPPQTRRAKALSGILRPANGEELVVRIYSPEAKQADVISINVLNGIQGITDLNRYHEEASGTLEHYTTPSEFLATTENFRPDPTELSRNQRIARRIQSAVRVVTRACKNVFIRQ